MINIKDNSYNKSFYGEGGYPIAVGDIAILHYDDSTHMDDYEETINNSDILESHDGDKCKVIYIEADILVRCAIYLLC